MDNDDNDDPINSRQSVSYISVVIRNQKAIMLSRYIVCHCQLYFHQEAQACNRDQHGMVIHLHGKPPSNPVKSESISVSLRGEICEL